MAYRVLLGVVGFAAGVLGLQALCFGVYMGWRT